MFKEVAALPAVLVTSPVNAGSLAPERMPLLISEASMLLFVNVCVSVVPTSMPLGAATAVVTLAAVRFRMPFVPGSARPEEFWPINVQTFGDEQPNRFCPAIPLVLKKRSPVEQAEGRLDPTLAGRVSAALEKSTLRPCVPKLTRV